MPRNSSGTYSLYTPGNPVVTSTVISSTWANNTLADLASAITDSLSRSGDGGMQAPLELDNGAIGGPGLTWATETTSGWYRASAGNFRFSISATDVLSLSSTGLVVGAATGGAQGAGTINATGVYDDGVLLTGANPTGTAGLTAVNGVATTFLRSDGAPAISQAITPTWTGAHAFTAATTFSNHLLAGTATVDVGATAQGVRRFYGVNGSAGSPVFGFSSDVDTGLFLVGSNQMGLAAGGVLGLQIVNNAAWLQPGTAADPSLAFGTDINTGLYLGGSDDLWMSLGGTGYPVGYRGMPSRTITTSDSTAATDNGRSILFTGAGSQTFTVDSDFGTASNICVLMNGGTGSLAVAESLSGTLTWLNGSGALSTGSRTLAIGGIMTIWMLDANNAYCWGTGIT